MLRARIAAALKRRRFALVASLHQDMAFDALAQVMSERNQSNSAHDSAGVDQRARPWCAECSIAHHDLSQSRHEA